MKDRRSCHSEPSLLVWTFATRIPPLASSQVIQPGYLTCTQRPSRFLLKVVLLPRSSRSLFLSADFRLVLLPATGTTRMVFMIALLGRSERRRRTRRAP